jgi:hypothetical protein
MPSLHEKEVAKGLPAQGVTGPKPDSLPGLLFKKTQIPAPHPALRGRMRRITCLRTRSAYGEGLFDFDTDPDFDFDEIFPALG